MGKRTDLIFGIHAVEQIIHNSPESILNLWVQHNLRSSAARYLLQTIHKLGIPIQFVKRSTLDKMTRAQCHQGILIEVRKSITKTEADLASVIAVAANINPLYLILDSIQDPHNLGACIRTAVAAGVTAILIPKHHAATVNNTVRKSASGAVERIIMITVVNLSRAIRQLKEAGIWVVGMAGESKNPIYNLDLTLPAAIVMGGENKGIRLAIKNECDYIASIPIRSEMESLNVSVATGIALFEAIRQRKNRHIC